MIEDLLLALRALRNRPAPSLLAVLCLSIGIGANVALGLAASLRPALRAGTTDPAIVLREE